MIFLYINYGKHFEKEAFIMKIFLDAGHGYSTPGKRSPDGMREYEFNRAVAICAKELLESYEGVSAEFAHADSHDVPLKERTEKANRLKADCYVSIHANASGSSWNEAGGIETFVHLSKPKEALALAEKIQKNLVLSSGLKNRGVKLANFHVLRETRMTAVLIECGFMTNKKEADLLRSEAYRKSCALAIVAGIAAHYRLAKSAASPPAGFYRVQVGAFSEKARAEALASRLKADGYPVLVVRG